MNIKGFYIWLASLCVFSVSLIPFIYFMFNMKLNILAITLSFIFTGAVLYVIGTRMMTHKKGYNLFQAREFYKKCCEAGFDSVKECKRNADKTIELAVGMGLSEKLTIADLGEMYTIGYEFISKKEKKVIK